MSYLVPGIYPESVYPEDAQSQDEYLEIVNQNKGRVNPIHLSQPVHWQKFGKRLMQRIIWGNTVPF